MSSDAESTLTETSSNSRFQSKMEVGISAEDESKRSDEMLLVSVKSSAESVTSRLKFSISRILGYDDLPSTGSHADATSGFTPIVIGRVRENESEPLQSSDRSNGISRTNCGNEEEEVDEEEEEEGDDDEEVVTSADRDEPDVFEVVELKGNSSVKRTAVVCGGGDQVSPPSPPPSSVSSLAASQRLSWLQCTRYKPPKLPRTKKSKEGSKKRKLGRNPRVPFTQHQVAALEQKFRHTHYLSSVDVAELSATLNLTENRVKIWFQNRRARERREKDGSPSGGGCNGCHPPASTVCIKEKLFLGGSTGDDADFKLHDSEVKSLSRPVSGTGVIPSLHAVMRAKGTTNYLTLAEPFELRPYFSAPGPCPSTRTSSVAIFENRMTSYSSTTWPPSVQAVRMSVPAADIFAHLSSSVISRRYSSAFGPINFLR